MNKAIPITRHRYVQLMSVSLVKAEWLSGVIQWNSMYSNPTNIKKADISDLFFMSKPRFLLTIIANGKELKMKTLKKLKEFFEWNLDGYDVALAIIGSLFGVVIGTAIFWLLVK